MKNIKLLIPEKWRGKFSKRLLDIAESLPTAKIGFISELQSMRERDRKYSEELYNNTRLDQNIKIEYWGISFFEIYHLEDIESLKDTASGIFKDSFSDTPQPDPFSNINPQLFSRQWNNAGIIYRERQPFGASKYYQVKELRKEIDYIHVGIHTILPSLVAVTFDVKLNDLATYELNNLLNKKYLSPTKINRYFFFGLVIF